MICPHCGETIDGAVHSEHPSDCIWDEYEDYQIVPISVIDFQKYQLWEQYKDGIIEDMCLSTTEPEKRGYLLVKLPKYS